jgi:hypothetical protein
VGLERFRVRVGGVVIFEEDGGSECLNWAMWDAKSDVDGGAMEISWSLESSSERSTSSVP